MYGIIIELGDEHFRKGTVILKKSIRTAFCLIAVLIVTLSFSSTAFAATMANNITLGPDYVIVVGNGNCSNKSVTITCYNNSTYHHNDVRMKDSNGNIVWEEYGAIDYSGQRTFYCGSNVYSIEVRVGAKNIIGDLLFPKVGSCNVVIW